MVKEFILSVLLDSFDVAGGLTYKICNSSRTSSRHKAKHLVKKEAKKTVEMCMVEAEQEKCNECTMFTFLCL